MVGIVDGGKKKIVLGADAGGEHLGDLHPFLFRSSGNEVKGCKGGSEERGHCASDEDCQRALHNGRRQGQHSNGVAHDDGGGSVGQPCCGYDQGQQGQSPAAVLF